jgi:hypothetical protein
VDHSLVTTFVDLFVVPFESSPAVEVVPKIIEAFYLVLCGVYTAKGRDGLDFRETSIKIENWDKGLEEIKVLQNVF